MKRLLILAMLACSVAAAQTPVPFPVGSNITLTWTAPTQNADGSTPAQVGGYNVYIASTDAALSVLGSAAGTKPGANMVAVGNALTYTFKAVPAGNYFYAVTTWNCTAAPCAESAQSAHVSATVLGSTKPGAPATVQISVLVTAPPAK